MDTTNPLTLKLTTAVVVPPDALTAWASSSPDAPGVLLAGAAAAVVNALAPMLPGGATVSISQECHGGAAITIAGGA